MNEKFAQNHPDAPQHPLSMMSLAISGWSALKNDAVTVTRRFVSNLRGCSIDKLRARLDNRSKVLLSAKEMPYTPSLGSFLETLPCAPLKGWVDVPAAPGVYVMCSPERILYIGECGDLMARLNKQGHETRRGILGLWENSIVKWYCSDECADKLYRRYLESALVGALCPLLNESHHTKRDVSVALPAVALSKLQSQAFRRGLPLSVWLSAALIAQSKLGPGGSI